MNLMIITPLIQLYNVHLPSNGNNSDEECCDEETANPGNLPANQLFVNAEINSEGHEVFETKTEIINEPVVINLKPLKLCTIFNI